MGSVIPKIAVVGLSIMMLSGCATITKGSRQDVEVKTDPSGLHARINTQQCVTPCTLQNVPRDAMGIAVIYNNEEKYYPLDKSFNFWPAVVGNIWNYGIGLLVDRMSHADKDIEPVNISFRSNAADVAKK